MGDVVAFPQKWAAEDDYDDLDLLTAVDAAIRDLREILAKWGEDGARDQAQECQLMLERVFYGIQ